MYFSTTSGIKTIDEEECNQYDVTSISGMSIGKFDNLSDIQSKLNKGVYIIKSGQKKFKITVK